MTSLTSHLPLQNLNTHPKTSLHSHNTTQSFVAFSPTHNHPHITSQNLSPPNLQNTPKHNPSLSNPNLINYRTLSNTASPSYHITKSLTTQPTKHTTKSPTSHLPPQTHNTHPKTSLHSHNTTQSFVAFSPTHHHPYITSQNLSPPNLQNTPKHNPSLSNPNLINYRTLSNTASPSYHITKSLTTQPTKHTTKSPTSHLPPQTHNTNQTKKLTDTNNIKKTTHPPHKQTDTTPTNQSSPGTPYITSLTPATLNSQHCPRTLKPTTQSTNSLLPTYHHTSTHIT